MNKLTRFHTLINVLVILIIAVVTGCSSQELPLTKMDKRVLLKISDFTPFVKEEAIDPTKGEMQKELISGNLYKLYYEYKFQGVYIQSVVYVASSIRDAKKKHSKFINGVKTRFSFIKGIALKEISSYRKWGDDSQFFLMIQNDESYGNAVTVIDGKKVYNLVITGIYFNGIKDFENTISPKLAYLRNYRP